MSLLPAALAEPFVMKALAAAIGLAVVAAPFGCVVVWRRMAYVGETLSQAALLGVALGLALDVNMTFAVIVAALIAAGLISAAGQQKLLALDSILGLMHHGLLALGIVAVAMLKGPGVDLMSFLFGDVFAISNTDLAVIFGGGIAVLAVIAWQWDALVRLSLHEDLAAAEGVDRTWPRVMFDLVLALVIAVGMKIVGVLLVMAFLVVPAVAARPWSQTATQMAVLAAAIAAGSVFAGIWASLVSDAPGGPAIVLAMCAVAVMSLLAAGRRAG